MKPFYFTWLCIAFALTVSAQGSLLPSANDSLLSRIPKKYLNQIENKSAQVQNFVDRRTSKALRHMSKLENQIQQKMEKADPQRAAELFGPASSRISNLKEKLIASSRQTGIGSGYVDNYTDSLESSLKFLQGAGIANLVKGKNIDAVKNGVAAIKDKMQLSENLKADLAARKQQLLQACSGLNGYKKLLGKYSKQVGYYRQQVDDFKEMLHDRSKAERKAMTLLRESGPYKDFLKKYPILGSLFNINMNEDPAQALLNLQSRAQVEQQIQQGIGSDPAAQQMVSQQMDQSASIIDQAKNSLPGGSGNVGDIPDQNLNPMKTKPYLKRLQYGADIQSQRSNELLPTMTDVSFQLGYKLNERLVAGAGAVYKIGWGKSLSHLTLSSEGIGIRSFATYKLKGIFHASAGLEYNHFMRITSVDQLKNWNSWTRSALAGVKIMIRENSKPKYSMLVLYDFLAAKSVPRSNTVKVRYQFTL